MVLIVICCHAVQPRNKNAAAIMPGVHEAYNDLNLYEVAYDIKQTLVVLIQLDRSHGGSYTIRSNL